MLHITVKLRFQNLFKTVHRNYAAIIGHLADQGADVDVGRNDGYTPLHAVAELGHVETLKTLMEKGADINKAVSSVVCERAL